MQTQVQVPENPNLAPVDAERALVAAALVDAGEVLEAANLPPEAFYHEGLRAFWRAIQELVREGAYPEIGLVVQRSGLPPEEARRLAGELFEFPASPLAAGQYAQAVRAAWGRRRAAQALAVTYQRLVSGGADPSAALLEVARLGEALAVEEGAEPVRLIQAAERLVETISPGQDRPRAVGLALSDYGQELLSVAPGELHLMAASTGVGKSAIALQLARAAASGGWKTLIYSLEMRAEDWAGRALVQLGALSSREMRMGLASEAALERVANGLGKLADLEVYVQDKLFAQDQILADIRRQARRGFRFFVVDYLGLVEMPLRSGEKRHQALEDLASALKRLALELGVAVLGIHQTNRLAEVDRKGAGIAAWGDSYQMLRPADGVYVLIRHKGEGGERLGEQAEWKREKVRNGALGVIPLRFDPLRMAFEEA
ncbi:AAA family ATPase [Thermus sp. SYSU G05001]|uniref:DNA 5'-3' helicase n=1 Tax=Thermus brevis TaxID=2862456 RepID=A0ABS7A2K6_9DEIN|nr:AAA family ATPase [Thermus brevis]